MKKLDTYISHVKTLHSLNEFIKETFNFRINRDTAKEIYDYHPTTWDELRELILQRYEEQGPGTKQKPIYFNDIDVSNIDSFYNEDIDKGLFEKTKFEYIDISNWDVSHVKNMECLFQYCYLLKSAGDLSNWNVSSVEHMRLMFYFCKKLKSVGDLSNWNVSKVKYMHSMFNECRNLESVGDLSNWNVSNAEYILGMFYECRKLKSVGDLSNWDVSKVKYMSFMFWYCEKLKSVGDLSKWNISNIEDKSNMFKYSGIINIPSWYQE